MKEAKKNTKITSLIKPMTILSISGILICLTIFLFSYTIMQKEYIHSGVYISGVNVSGLTKENAKTVLFKNVTVPRLDLSHGVVISENLLSKIDFTYDYNAGIEKAYAVGRSGNLLSDIFTIMGAVFNKTDIPLPQTYDEQKLERLCDEVTAYINSEPVNAKIEIDNGKTTIVEGKTGVKVNTDEFKNKIYDYIKSENKADTTIEVPFSEQPPAIRYSDLKDLNVKLGSYTTRYSEGKYGRPYNIRLTSQKLSGSLIMPGEEVSFLKTIGDITYSQGFQDAIVIINNEFKTGIGGGVCQVSSTLYNALLQSGITVTERTTHSLPVGYVPKGMDATVAVPGPDLKYKNNTDSPVYINSYTSYGTITVDIYGKSQKQ